MSKELVSRDILDDILELYEKYHPYLATSVLEFGDALKDLIDKAPTVEDERIRRGLETIQTVIDNTNGNTDNVSKAIRNTAKIIRNAIDGEMPDYENVEGEDCGERPTGEWIPVKYRPMTTEERKEFAEHYGIEYCDTADEKALDCPMPEDGQEILISTKWGVCTDVADNDIDCDGYNTYGLEGNGDWDGVLAWMPLPEPYKKGE